MIYDYGLPAAAGGRQSAVGVNFGQAAARTWQPVAWRGVSRRTPVSQPSSTSTAQRCPANWRRRRQEDEQQRLGEKPTKPEPRRLDAK